VGPDPLVASHGCALAEEPEQTIDAWFYITATDRSTVDRWLALRPGSRPKPECHRRRGCLRYEAGGLGYRF
jgi:hypothetical protein